MTRRDPQSQRLVSVDALRGLIMIAMALDHASAFVAEQHFSEFWGTPLPDYGDAFSLWTRVVSHLCAPGFFLLMGAGMSLFTLNRRTQGWSEPRIARYFATRGVTLVLVDLLVVFPAFVLGMTEAMLREGDLIAPALPGGGGIPYFSPGVLTALGVCMLVAGLLCRLSPGWWGALAALLLLCSQLLLPPAASHAVQYPVPLRMLLIAGQSGPALISYPLLPWLAVALIGMLLGVALARDPERTLSRALPAGVGALVLFVLIRVAGGFGTHHPMPTADWMGLFSVTKYPASLAFLFLSLGTNLILLWLLNRLAKRDSGAVKWLLAYGRAPLFFYVAHLYLYALASFWPGKTSLLGMYPVWAIGVVLLYSACLRYDRFKRRKPEDSLWRLF